MHIHLMLLFFSFAILFMFVSLILNIRRFLYKNKYGRAVFKVDSDKYKRSINDKKEILMNVTPFKENETIYLPLKYIVSSLKIKDVNIDEKNTMIFRYNDKNIQVTEEIIIIKRNEGKIFQKIDKNIKIINSEIMLPIKCLKNLFNIKIDYNEDTKEIIIW